MKRALLSAAAAVLVVAGSAVGAVDLGGTSWDCSTVEIYKVKRYGKDVQTNTGISLSFGATTWNLSHPDWGDYDGTWEPKGKSGLKALPGPAALEDFKEYIRQTAQDLLGADDVTVDTFKMAIKGKRLRDGNLVVLLKAKGKGTASLFGQTRKGSASVKAVLAGTENL